MEHTEMPDDQIVIGHLLKAYFLRFLQIFMEEKYVPIHVKSHHLIAQEYVCTYKECGEKFTNKQDLTYHLGMCQLVFILVTILNANFLCD